MGNIDLMAIVPYLLMFILGLLIGSKESREKILAFMKSNKKAKRKIYVEEEGEPVVVKKPVKKVASSRNLRSKTYKSENGKDTDEDKGEVA